MCGFIPAFSSIFLVAFDRIYFRCALVPRVFKHPPEMKTISRAKSNRRIGAFNEHFAGREKSGQAADFSELNRRVLRSFHRESTIYAKRGGGRSSTPLTFFFFFFFFFSPYFPTRQPVEKPIYRGVVERDVSRACGAEQIHFHFVFENFRNSMFAI